MPAKLALFLCTVFVLFLLRLERKQAPKVSVSLWVPTIWMLLIVSKPVAAWFGTGGVDMESGSPLDRAFFSGLFCVGLFILVNRRFDWSSAIRENKWTMLLFGYILVSILWSDIPYTSFKRSSRGLIAIVMAMVIATEPEPRHALQSVFRRTIYVLIPFSYILIHYFPEYGRHYTIWSGELMWNGVALQKNSFARLCLFALFFLIWTLNRRRQGHDIPVTRYQILVEVFLLILTTWLFMGPQHTFSYSATSAAALAVGLTAFIGLLWMKKQGKLIGAGTLTVIVAIIIIYGTITPFIGRLIIYDPSSVFGRSETLTGRAEIWAILVPLAMEKPILGYGSGGFYTDAIRAQAIAHAHNGYLEVILNLGFVGLIFFSIFLLSGCRKAQRVITQEFDWGVLWICYLLMGVVHNIAESTLTSFANHMLAVLLFFDISSNAGSSNADVA